MGTGKSRAYALLVAGVAAAALLFVVPASRALEHRSGIWNVLRAGHFDGPMNENAHVRPIPGSIAANGARYRFWEYTWENGPHGGQAVLVFQQDSPKLSYIGYFETSLEDFRGPVHPVIRDTDLFFPFRDIEIMGVKNSFALSFKNGPPANVKIVNVQKGQ